MRSILLAASLSCSLLTGTSAAQDLTKEEALAIAKEAAIHALPVLDSYASLYAETDDDDDDRYLAPLNQLVSEARVFTPEDRDVRTPNLDIAHAAGWLDLRAQPVVLGLPAFDPGRYHSVQLVDLQTYNFGYIGSRTTGDEAGRFLVTSPGWAGELPEGIQGVFRSGSDFVRADYRTQHFGAEDLETVRGLMDQFTIEPLSDFLGEPAPPVQAEEPLRDLDVEDLTGLDLLVALDELLPFCPPTPDDTEQRARFARIGIGAGEPFSPGDFPGEIRDAMEAGVAEGMAAVASAAAAAASTGLHGDRAFFAGDDLKRAVGAERNLHATARLESMQPLYVSDADGNPLDGSTHRYVVNLSGANLPPVDAFWALTLYDRKHEALVANPINRYQIDSEMLEDMKRDGNGGVTLLIQQQSPGLEMESNWLPAPDGPFYMVLRLYWPKPEAVDGTWKPPLVFGDTVAEKAAPAPSGAELTQEVAPLAGAESAAPVLGRPSDWGEPTEVRIGIYVIDVDEINSAEQSFSASVYYEARWNSSFLRHKGPGPVHRASAEVWTPRLTIIGQQSVWASFPAAVEIMPDGEVILRQKLWGHFSQPLDLHDFPQDEQTISFHIAAAGMLEEHVSMIPLDRAHGRRSGISESFSVPDFDVVSWNAEATPWYPTQGEQGTAAFLLQIQMKRKFGYYVMKVLIPLCLIVMMSWLPRWISLSETSSNIGISTTAFLTLVAYLFAITVLLPRVSYITRMDRFILLSMMMVFGCLVQTVMNTILIRRGKVSLAQRLDVVSRFIYPAILVWVLVASFEF